MIHILADIAPATNAIGAVEQWLKILFWLSGGVTAVVVAFSHLTGNSRKRELQQPLEVKPSVVLVTKEDHEKHVSEIKAELKSHAEKRSAIYDEQAAQSGEIKAIKAEVSAAKDNLDKVEDKIDANTALTSKIDGKVEQINQSMSQLTVALTSFMRDWAKKS